MCSSSEGHIGGHLVDKTATYRCDDTRGCVMQFWTPDDEHMCSKHVEEWNKLIVKQKFCASSWLITEIINSTLVPFYTMRHWGSWGVDPHFLNFGSRSQWGFSFTASHSTLNERETCTNWTRDREATRADMQKVLWRDKSLNPARNHTMKNLLSSSWLSYCTAYAMWLW